MSAKKFTQTEKAAAILLSLGPDAAAEILRGFPREDVRRIVGVLARLGRIDQPTVGGIMNDFADKTAAMKQGLEGSPQVAARFLARCHPERGIDASSIIDTASSELRETLATIASNILSNHLRTEHPQAVAVTAVHMQPKALSQLLKSFSAVQQTDIIERIAKLGPVDANVIREITQTLKTLTADAGRLQARKGGVAQLAAILNALPPGDQGAMIKNLTARAPALSEAVQAAMFTFHDLLRIDARSMQRLLRDIPEADLRAALRGADQALMQHVLNALSERQAKQLTEDIAEGKKLPLHVVETARALMAGMARTLLDKGEIQLSDELVSTPRSA